jgi:plastocyanin
MSKNKGLWIALAVVVVVVVVYVVVAGVHTSPSIPSVANTPAGTQTDLGTVTTAGVVAATGTSAIASSGIVVAPTGKPTENNVAPASPTAPQESNPIADVKAVPSAAIKLTVSVTDGFKPNTFSVSAGAPVTISVTAGDQSTHIFAFKDASLSAVAVGVGPGETRAITFNAPTKAGTYDFYSNVPGQSGETGTMTVK